MSWYILLTLVSLVFCFLACLYHTLRIIRTGAPRDFAKPAGNKAAGISYSFIGAMSPKKKESAYLHLPTYTAGIIYHLGTFICILLLVINLFGIHLPETASYMLTAFIVLSGSSGLAILVKRIVKKELSSLSNPDDYISNILVTAFQWATAVYLIIPTPVYFILVSILLLYLPVGKLKHAVYFFAARFQLGVFFGRRGVWPPKN